VKDWNNCSKK